jgi:hypothetical protein
MSKASKKINANLIVAFEIEVNIEDAKTVTPLIRIDDCLYEYKGVATSHGDNECPLCNLYYAKVMPQTTSGVGYMSESEIKTALKLASTLSMRPALICTEPMGADVTDVELYGHELHSTSDDNSLFS